MKQIYATFTILRTLYVPDDYTDEDVNKEIQKSLAELNLEENDVDDIEWGEA